LLCVTAGVVAHLTLPAVLSNSIVHSCKMSTSEDYHVDLSMNDVSTLSSISYSNSSNSTLSSCASESDVYGWSKRNSWLRTKADLPVSHSRAHQIVSRLSQSAISILLAPIQAGLLDPQSAMQIYDAINCESVSIRVNDFLQIIGSFNTQLALESFMNLDEGNVPRRLLDAAKRLSNTENQAYASVTTSRSVSYNSIKDFASISSSRYLLILGSRRLQNKKLLLLAGLLLLLLVSVISIASVFFFHGNQLFKSNNYLPVEMNSTVTSNDTTTLIPVSSSSENSTSTTDSDSTSMIYSTSTSTKITISTTTTSRITMPFHTEEVTTPLSTKKIATSKFTEDPTQIALIPSTTTILPTTVATSSTTNIPTPPTVATTSK
jgi:hypothetical protein